MKLIPCCICGILGLISLAAHADDALPSWNESAAKASIINIVKRVTTDGSADFVAPADRIAVFDNDGTLWAEQPVYFQLLFAIDRVKALAPQHPEWAEKEPFKSAIAGDLKSLAHSDKHGLIELVMAAHAGMTVEEFNQIVRDWIATAKHPTKNVAYTKLVYQPMLEVLGYLRANGFRTYIVSGGGVEFVRAFSQEVYGIPPEQVIGSSIRTKFEIRDSKPVLVRLPEIDFIDDKEGKPVGIQKFIGRRPVMCFGNSDGDLQMLQYTSVGPGPRFGLLVHHTDKEREWAYDRESHIGKLDKALDEARTAGWTVVDMKAEWARIFASDE